jgi:hypothetical protein
MIIVLCLPQDAPITINNMNYSPIALGIVLLGAFFSWVVSARFWFKGTFCTLHRVDLKYCLCLKVDHEKSVLFLSQVFVISPQFNSTGMKRYTDDETDASSDTPVISEEWTVEDGIVGMHAEKVK